MLVGWMIRELSIGSSGDDTVGWTADGWMVRELLIGRCSYLFVLSTDDRIGWMAVGWMVGGLLIG